MNLLSLAEKRGIIFAKQKKIARSARWFIMSKILEESYEYAAPASL